MPLIKLTAEFKLYVPVDTDLSPATFMPACQKVEDQWISVVLGAAQLAALQTAYDTSTLTTAQTNLLDQVRKAEASLALQALIPILSVRMGDSGVLVSAGADQGRAMQWQVDDLRNQLLFDGYNALDNLYRFLFANIVSYPLWGGSDAYNQFTQYFINQVSDFQRHVDIDNSNWIFRKMIPAMETLELSDIYLTIGQPFFDYLKAQILANTLAGDDLTAVQMLQKPIALFTYARALMDPDFSELINIFKRPRADAQDRRKWEKPDYSNVANSYRLEGDAMLTRAKIYFNTLASPSVFAAYYTSDRYQDPAKRDLFKRDGADNANSTGSFFF